MILASKMLGRYFMRVFLRAMLGAFLICFCIILVVDFVERLRQFSTEEGFSFFIALQIAFYRTPSIAEQVWPFSVLIGAIFGFVKLSGKLELTVARAAGLSVWQFIQPALFIALALGLFSSLVYNPAAVWFWKQSERIEVETLSKGGQGRNQGNADILFRQEGPEGSSILSAKRAINNGKILIDVTALIFDEDDNFREQVEAASANWKEGYWSLNKAKLITSSAPPLEQEHYQLATFLSEEQINKKTERIENITFWALPSLVETNTRAGLETSQLRLKYQVLLARPLLFAAMVLIAATVSLRLSRFGSLTRMILGGVTAGFVLYIVSEISGDFGANGLLHPILAAWIPVFIAMILGVTVLLYQEDG